MNTPDDSPLAFPRSDGGYSQTLDGMSLRDYFAGQGVGMASHDLGDTGVVAARAYAIADAMLKERAK
jgi:hypothetical protein